MDTTNSVAKRRKVDDEYYASYADLQCHQSMVADTSRTNAYRFSILRAYESFYKRTVMDIGCGTGILSLFCAQAGASRVFAVEASALASLAKKVVEANSFQNKISVIHSTVEDIVNLPDKCERVDIIVSEWMGYTLLSEWMLKSVLYARDRFLRTDGKGVMVPSRAVLYMAPVRETEWLINSTNFWSTTMDRYRVNLDCLIEDEYAAVMGKMFVHDVAPEEIIGRSAKVLDLDLQKMKTTDLDSLTASFELTCFGHERLFGFCFWFQVDLPAAVYLTTSPYAPEQTHWAQTVVYLKESVEIEQDAVIKGQIWFKPAQQNERLLAIRLQYSIGDGVLVEQCYNELIDG